MGVGGQQYKRTIGLHVRISELEYAALIRLCANEQARQSEVVRRLLREEARARGVWPAPERAEAVRHA